MRSIALPSATIETSAKQDAAKTELRFNRDIRPILSDNCFRCHGPELKSRKAKLRLDDRDVAVQKGAIVPGKPDESEMLRRIATTNADDVMPPPELHKTITPAQRETLRRWVSEGAKYEPHWSYAPLVRPPVPPVRDAKWTNTPIDSFILARLEEQSIKPSPAADRRTLLRRLSLDLTGLPPTPEEADRFVKDHSRNAWAKQVDRLLASPHFGERMAVPWLDAVRFADTVGYHGDQNVNVFPYRDYVIDSFNRNKPFDQFTIEQIAGDLLPNPTAEQKIATGFNRLNMVTREGGAQPKEYLAKYQADRVRTISTAWLGSTMACSECHDHKYDPFTQKDFYSMGAFFADVRQWGVYMEYAFTPNPDLRGFSNDHPFPPEITVTNRYLLERENNLRAELQKLCRAEFASATSAKTGRAGFQMWEGDIRKDLKNDRDGWHVDPKPLLNKLDTNSATAFSILPDGSIVASGNSAKHEKIQVGTVPPQGWLSAIRLELLPHPAHANSSLRASAKNARISLSASVRHKNGSSVPVVFYQSAATAKLPEYVNGHELPNVSKTSKFRPNRFFHDPSAPDAGYDAGEEISDAPATWKFSGKFSTNRQFAVYAVDPPMRLAEGDTLKVVLDADDLGCVRIATTPLANADALQSGANPELVAALNRSSGRRTAAQNGLLESAWLLGTTNNPPLFAALKNLGREIRECRNGTSPTLVTESTTNLLVMRVLPRGNWQDESGPIVQPAVPHFLPQPPGSAERHLTRLDLARWLVSTNNPLTPRAFVNRLWKQFFGNGLSNQPEELGAQGEWPTHPELLDWLAAEFRDSGWDVKHLVRLMVMSSVYQQDSRNRPELRDVDPNNRLLSRQNPRRLDAEFVRDNALFIAGILNTNIGGPSAFPYQPADYYANLQFPSREYKASAGELQYRRGLYTHWQRTFLHPMLVNFDAPAREECTVDRPVSSTPQQALTLLNDPSFVEAARVFAANLLCNAKLKSDSARINAAFENTLLRDASGAEQESLQAFLKRQREYYHANPADAEKLVSIGIHPPATGLKPSEQAAWTSLTRVLLNLHETITRY